MLKIFDLVTCAKYAFSKMMKALSATLKCVNHTETVIITAIPIDEVKWVGQFSATLFNGDSVTDISDECFYAGGWKIDLSKYPDEQAVIKLTSRPSFANNKTAVFIPLQVDINNRLTFISNCSKRIGRESLVVEIRKNKKGANFKIFN